MSVRVLLVDDQPMMRAGLRILLEQDTGIDVVGEASCGSTALDLVRSLAPDVVLMDVAMPGMNGIDATRLICDEYEHVRVLALSTHSDTIYVGAMLEAGACGYALKSEAHDELLPAVHEANLGRTHLSPKIVGLAVAPTTTACGRDAGASDSTLGSPGRAVADRKAESEAPLENDAGTRLPWKDLLAEPGECGHIAQLYEDVDFYTAAISSFAAEGLKRNEAVILVPTAPHREIIARRLTGMGFDLDGLLLRGQMTMLDANATLPRFMAGDMPGAEAFKALAGKTIASARSKGWARVRWWGEMVNVLYVDGNQRASTRLEELFDEIAHEESIAIFCSYLMGKFDRSIYNGPLQSVCRTHSHLIPAQDYALHQECVDRAVAEVAGKIEVQLPRSLDDFPHRPLATMPASQAALLWLREAGPVEFKNALEAARAHELNRLPTSPDAFMAG